MTRILDTVYVHVSTVYKGVSYHTLQNLEMQTRNHTVLSEPLKSINTTAELCKTKLPDQISDNCVCVCVCVCVRARARARVCACACVRVRACARVCARGRGEGGRE